MEMSGSQRIAAPREKVWAALNDPAVLRRCIPGCETLEKTGDNEMAATVVLKVGPVKAAFKGSVALSDIDPPNGYVLSGEGSAGVAGFAKGRATVRLEADGPATVLRYDVKSQIGGKLAQLGARLIDSTAKLLAAEFFEKFALAAASPDVEALAGAPAQTGDAQEPGWLARMLQWLRRLFIAAPAAIVLLLAPDCCLNGSHGQGIDHDFFICSSVHALRRTSGGPR
ncbi:MAG TPA: carbon monoxide dehydrogenase subunit G [Rhodoblastus sp.]|nr:carbon monoxide dehydrogenase subunit G [Rhodoblastus sp.]